MSNKPKIIFEHESRRPDVEQRRWTVYNAAASATRALRVEFGPAVHQPAPQPQEQTSSSTQPNTPAAYANPIFQSTVEHKLEPISEYDMQTQQLTATEQHVQTARAHVAAIFPDIQQGV